MSWLSDAIAKGKGLARQDQIDKQVREEEERRAAEQRRKEQEQLQLERERLYAPWLREVKTLLQDFSTKEMARLGYSVSPIEYGSVSPGKTSIDWYTDHGEFGPHYFNRGYIFKVTRYGKKEVAYTTDEMRGGLFLLTDKHTLDFHFNLSRTGQYSPPGSERTFQSPREFAAFLQEILSDWVADIVRTWGLR